MPGPRGVTEGSPLSRCGHVASALRRRVWAPCVALSLLPSSTSCSLWPPSLRPVRRGPACPCGPLLFLLVLWSCPASPMPSQERRGWVAGSFPVTQSHTQCWSEAFLGGGGTAVCASAAQGDGGRTAVCFLALSPQLPESRGPTALRMGSCFRVCVSMMGWLLGGGCARCHLGPPNYRGLHPTPGGGSGGVADPLPAIFRLSISGQMCF